MKLQIHIILALCLCIVYSRQKHHKHKKVHHHQISRAKVAYSSFKNRSVNEYVNDKLHTFSDTVEKQRNKPTADSKRNQHISGSKGGKQIFETNLKKLKKQKEKFVNANKRTELSSVIPSYEEYFTHFHDETDPVNNVFTSFGNDIQLDDDASEWTALDGLKQTSFTGLSDDDVKTDVKTQQDNYQVSAPVIKKASRKSNVTGVLSGIGIHKMGTSNSTVKAALLDALNEDKSADGNFLNTSDIGSIFPGPIVPNDLLEEIKGKDYLLSASSAPGSLPVPAASPWKEAAITDNSDTPSSATGTPSNLESELNNMFTDSSMGTPVHEYHTAFDDAALLNDESNNDQSKEEIASIQLGDATREVKIPSTIKLVQKFAHWVKKLMKNNAKVKMPQIKTLKKKFTEWLKKVFSGNYKSSDKPGFDSTFDEFLMEGLSEDDMAHIVIGDDAITDWIDHENFTEREPATNSSGNFYQWLDHIVNPKEKFHLHEWLHNSTLNYISDVDDWLENATKIEETYMNMTQKWLKNQTQNGNSNSSEFDNVDIMSLNTQPYHIHYPPNHIQQPPKHIYFAIHTPDNENHHVDYHVHHDHGHVHHYYDHYYDNTSKSLSVDHFVSSVHPCANGGIIVPLGIDGYQCICPKGFIGTKCDEVDYCAKCPCKNNGTCNPIEIYPRYKCTCRKTFYGKHCEKRNPCEPNVCMNNGKCSHDDKGHIQCICIKGFRGQRCEEIDSCVPSPCKNAGTCDQVTGNGKFVCNCLISFKGPLCELQTFCPSHPCQNGGTCRETNDDFECTCPLGYIGKTCTERPCLPNPCYNGATCVETVEDNKAEYHCLCTPWASGRNCTVISPCRLKPCRTNGQCIDAVTGFRWSFKPMQYYCLCRPPYMGPYCTDNMCNHCSPYGHCDNQSRCVCDDGYYGNGYICEAELPDPCIPNPCANKGVCINEGNGDYHCHCKQPFQPPRCLIGEPCTPDPCKNGRCTSSADGSFKCHCFEGYRGAHCNITDPCHPNPCQHDGTCSVHTNGTLSCECHGKWKNPTCRECDCPPSPDKFVRPGTHCNDVGKCECNHFNASDWLFKRGTQRCEPVLHNIEMIVNKTRCFPDNPCKNGGTCQLVAGGDKYTCQCSKWFMGKDCEVKRACIPQNPCLNGGTCIEDGKGNFTCKCPPGTGNWKCDASPTPEPTVLHHCQPNPCKNNGICHELKTGYDCHCPPRFTGAICDMDRCKDCEQNAHCVLGHCRCNSGYVGNGYECVREVIPRPKCGHCPMYSYCVHPAGYCSCQQGYQFVDRICLPLEDYSDEEDTEIFTTTKPTTLTPLPNLPVQPTPSNIIKRPPLAPIQPIPPSLTSTIAPEVSTTTTTTTTTTTNNPTTLLPPTSKIPTSIRVSTGGNGPPAPDATPTQSGPPGGPGTVEPNSNGSIGPPSLPSPVRSLGHHKPQEALQQQKHKTQVKKRKKPKTTYAIL